MAIEHDSSRRFAQQIMPQGFSPAVLCYGRVMEVWNSGKGIAETTLRVRAAIQIHDVAVMGLTGLIG